MSHSGVPVVQQIGEAGETVGNAVGNLLKPKAPDVVAPPPVANPEANAETGNKLQSAEEEENRRMGRGMAANMLSGGGYGFSLTSPNVARTTLLGS